MQTSNINRVSQKQQKYQLVDDVKLNHSAVKYYQKQKFIITLNKVEFSFITKSLAKANMPSTYLRIFSKNHYRTNPFVPDVTDEDIHMKF